MQHFFGQFGFIPKFCKYLSRNLAKKKHLCQRNALNLSSRHKITTPCSKNAIFLPWNVLQKNSPGDCTLRFNNPSMENDGFTGSVGEVFRLQQLYIEVFLVLIGVSHVNKLQTMLPRVQIFLAYHFLTEKFLKRKKIQLSSKNFFPIPEFAQNAQTVC